MKTTDRHSSPKSNAAFAALRNSVEREFAFLNRQQPRLFRLALNEAEALAWETGFPALVFPVLANEKVRAIAQWHSRQSALKAQEFSVAFAA